MLGCVSNHVAVIPSWLPLKITELATDPAFWKLSTVTLCALWGPQAEAQASINHPSSHQDQPLFRLIISAALMPLA